MFAISLLPSNSIISLIMFLAKNHGAILRTSLGCEIAFSGLRLDLFFFYL